MQLFAEDESVPGEEWWTMFEDHNLADYVLADYDLAEYNLQT